MKISRMAIRGVGAATAPVRSELSRRAREKRESPEVVASDTPEVVAILESAEFGQQVGELAERLSVPTAVVLSQAGGHLRELAASHIPSVTERWHSFGRWMLRGYDVLLDEEGLAKLRALDREHSLVFLISHRSYLDEWAIPTSLVDFGIDPPFGFAGANLDFFPLGTVARRTGIVHIRRTTAGAPVYKFALRTFMRQLIRGHANLIWSIEGGRTRTGKLRPPRFGLLRYVVDAVSELESSEVLLVPVSVLYDQLPTHEVELMTSEARGQGKRPEDAKWFYEYIRGLRKRMGRIYVDFGEPLDLRARLMELDSQGPSEGHAVERIAVEVSHRINKATPVTPTAGVCIALLAVDRALTLDEILSTMQPLAAYLESRRWPTAGAASLRDKPTVRRALQDLVASGVLTSFQGESTVWGIGEQQHLVAAVYRNSAIHVLVQRALIELVMVRMAEPGQAEVDPVEEALRLRDLLKFEFFFAGREEFLIEIQAELDLINADVSCDLAKLGQAQAQELLDGQSLFTAHLTLRPFIDAYAVVAEQLLQMGSSSGLDEARFMDRCLVLAQQWALQRHIASEESASTEMFRNALRLADHLSLVESDAHDLAVRRAAFAREIDGIRKRIALLAERDTRV